MLETFELISKIIYPLHSFVFGFFFGKILKCKIMLEKVWDPSGIKNFKEEFNLPKTKKFRKVFERETKN